MCRRLAARSASLFSVLVLASCSGAADGDERLAAGDAAPTSAEATTSTIVATTLAAKGDPEAIARCTDYVRSDPLRGVVAGGYLQTVREVQEWVERDLRAKAAITGGPAPSMGSIVQGNAQAEQVVAVCWVDGIVNVSTPPPPEGATPLVFDRRVLLLHPDGTDQQLFATGSERTAVVRPSDGARGD